MKKIIILILITFITLGCFSACGNNFADNEWYSSEKLSECLVTELPVVQNDYVNENDQYIYVKFTNLEYKAYVKSIFDYLSSQNYKYFGTRGDQVNTLAGAFTTYYFKPASSLSEFFVDGHYRFVYSNGALNENGEIIFNLLTIYNYETTLLEYNKKAMYYNTLISLRVGSEAPLSGFYIMREETPHEHTYGWNYLNDEYHSKRYTCGCAYMAGGLEAHVDENSDKYCDICNYMILSLAQPEDYLLRYQSGAEWLNDISADDINEAKIVNTGYSVAPGNFKFIKTSTNSADVTKLFNDCYSVETIPSLQPLEVEGGFSISVIFVLKDGTIKELNFTNFVYTSNNNYFQVYFNPEFDVDGDYNVTNSFISYDNIALVYDNNKSLLGKIYVDSFEFTEVEYASTSEPYYVVKTEFGNLLFYSTNVFVIEGTNAYYKIIGENLINLMESFAD